MFKIRVAHANDRYLLKSSYFPDFIDIVLWGHEHDSRINEKENVLFTKLLGNHNYSAWIFNSHFFFNERYGRR